MVCEREKSSGDAAVEGGGAACVMLPLGLLPV